VNDAPLVCGGQDGEKPIGDEQDLVGGESAFGLGCPSVEVCAYEQLHHQKDASIVVDVVVEDANGVGMLDPIGDVTLATEVRSHGGVIGPLVVQDFDGPAQPVAMGRGIDGSHSADSQKAFQMPLAAQRPADSCFDTVQTAGLELRLHERTLEQRVSTSRTVD
jgi:hypothetical protein